MAVIRWSILNTGSLYVIGVEARVEGDPRVGKLGAGALLSLGAGLAERASGTGKDLGVGVLELGAPWGGGAGVAENDGSVGGVIGVVVSTEAAIVGSELVIGVVFGVIIADTESGPPVVLFGGIERGVGGVDDGGADGVVVSEVPMGAVDVGKTAQDWCV